ncbi:MULTISPECIES: hypothetical protein [unclassified Microbacterium]|uniref:hypothetical protein n=1 Tax=unclassified Microbacterium TaxID=2609290 RepID=UPI00386AB0EE
MTVGFLRDRATHTFAAVQGWLYAPSEALQIAYWQRDLHRLDSTPEKERSRWKPIPRPWEPVKAAPKVTDEVRARIQRHRQRVQGQHVGSEG